jgi:hypothetical protein
MNWMLLEKPSPWMAGDPELWDKIKSIALETW